MFFGRLMGGPRVGWVGLALLGVLAVGLAPPAAAQRFLPDDPLWSDPDRMDMPFPATRPVDEGSVGPVGFVRRMFGVSRTDEVPAVNVNTVEGVPNSSWYTNRHYRFPRSAAELQNGPNDAPGPAMEAPWTVTRFREGGLPRAVMKDSTGRRFSLLFDAAAHPELATGAGMIGSRLLHALGYNVPHYWLRRIERAQLAPSPDEGVTGAGIDSLLARTPSAAGDEAYRVLVSRIPDSVRRIGPFQFRGSREDDANDVFPHEDRRELRALRVVGAWLHHSMIRPRHTLDVGVREEGRQFVRHYLTDLHLTLGSAGAAPKPPWSGHEHLLELEQIVRRVATVGLSGDGWAETVVPNAPGVGHFEASGFEPRQWRPEWPNPAFRRLTPADAFWAAKQIRHFSRSDLRAVVATAEYSSPATVNYITETLLLRRDAIGRAYLDWGGGLARFGVRGGHLRFRDLRARYGDAPDSLRRTVTWHVYDNQTETLGRRLARTTSRREALSIPPSRAAFLRVRLQSEDGGETRVFLRRTISAGGSLPPMSMPYEVVGVERRGKPANP